MEKPDLNVIILIDVINDSHADEQVLSDRAHGGVSVSENWHWRKLASFDGISAEACVAAARL